MASEDNRPRADDMLAIQTKLEIAKLQAQLNQLKQDSLGLHSDSTPVMLYDVWPFDEMYITNYLYSNFIRSALAYQFHSNFAVIV